MAEETKPDGWHACSQAPEHVLHDGLFINGIMRASVQAFGDEGPWYAHALRPDGEHHRLGAGESHTAAAEWCERITGYRVELPVPAGQTKGEA